MPSERNVQGAFLFTMRYYYEKPDFWKAMFAKTYVCNHPLYSKCTLYKIKNYGLAVIQQRFNPETKTTYWTEIDPWLIDEIYIQPGFKKYFNQMSGIEQSGLYPTVNVRQLMWALRMKPMRKERWETVFDRKDI